MNCAVFNFNFSCVKNIFHFLVCGKTDDSIEMTREKSPFMKMCRTESPVTPFISPKVSIRLVT